MQLCQVRRRPATYSACAREMRRKRFSHYAHAICDKFCGWERWPDESLFKSRQGGMIVADALKGTATLDGVPQEFVALGGVRDWLFDDLKHNNIEVGALSAARIELEFRWTRRPDSSRPVSELHFRGRGVIVSGEDTYVVPYEKVERY